MARRAWPTSASGSSNISRRSSTCRVPRSCSRIRSWPASAWRSPLLEGRPLMRWGLRYQLLMPPLLLLAAVAGITAWTALASAQRARQQLDARVRQVVEALNRSEFPRNDTGYKLLHLLSGAELLALGVDQQVL